MLGKQQDKYHSRADEYIKRYGKRPCAEWHMRVAIDVTEYGLSKKIDASQKKLRKEMATLTVASIAINMIISLLLHKWKYKNKVS